MARALLVIVLAGCVQQAASTADDTVDPPRPGRSCSSDAQCTGGFQCAHTGACFSPSDLRAVQVNWTVDGMPATATACDALGALEITFEGTAALSKPLTFLPLACAEGRFSIDKMPRELGMVKIGDRQIGWQSTEIDATTGSATIDLISR